MVVKKMSAQVVYKMQNPGEVGSGSNIMYAGHDPSSMSEGRDNFANLLIEMEDV